MKFKHAGIEISLQQDGEFTATVGAEFVRKPSLDAMKKYIDNAAKTKFEPFEAIREKSYRDKPADDDGFIKVKVIGITKETRRGRYGKERFYFKESEGHQTHEELLVDSQENRAAFKAVRDFMEETHRIEQERREKLSELREDVKYHKAEEYKATGK